MTRQTWVAHVKAYRAENPSLSWRQALEAARASYKELPTGPKTRKENKWLSHVMAVKGSNPAIAFKDILKLAKESYTKTVVPATE